LLKETVSPTDGVSQVSPRGFNSLRENANPPIDPGAAVIVRQYRQDLPT